MARHPAAAGRRTSLEEPPLMSAGGAARRVRNMQNGRHQRKAVIPSGTNRPSRRWLIRDTIPDEFRPFRRTNKKHGLKNPAGPHAGDMQALTAGADGTAHVQFVDTLVSLAEPAPNSLFHPNGTAIVIHAAPDDQMTDPSGNSGARIACGVITK